MRTKILADVLTLAGQSAPLPDFSNEAAVAAWVGKLTQGITTIVYDAIESDPVAMKALAKGGIASYKPRELKAALPKSKIGDGTILKFLQSVDWAAVIQTVLAIIAVIPKTPTPAAS